MKKLYWFLMGTSLGVLLSATIKTLGELDRNHIRKNDDCQNGKK